MVGIDEVPQTGPEMTQYFEGYRPSIYRDTRKKRTIGYGFNVDDKTTAKLLPADVIAGKRPLYKAEAQQIFAILYKQAAKDAISFVGPETFAQLDPQRQRTLVDMAYNLGSAKLGQFSKFRNAVQTGDYNRAANEMINSNWYGQVGRRSKYHVKKMRGR